MARNKRTYRVVDGEQIEGTWRPIFIRNGTSYFLTDLLIFADGAINCWDWVDLDGLRQKLETGRVATHLEPGMQASAHHLASWRFDEPQMWVTAEELLGEVADEIDHLNDRPDSTDRCLQALDRYLQTRTEADRQLLRAAYLAVPEHVRHYALGDMDAKDWPLRMLCTAVGEHTTHDELVTEAMHLQAHEYFEEREKSAREWHDNRPADGPDQAQDPTVKLASVPGQWPTAPGIECLRNEYPTTVEIGGDTYASAVHAYWALATTDESVRTAIHHTAMAFSVERTVEQAPLRHDWPHLRLTAMHAILRAKFTQHPELADVLVATGDARIEYNISSAYWSGGAKGRNWLGRLLELVRAEIVAQRAGFVP
ncbi:NADAR family protein [Actinoplanes subtropicus]|uniref:NADAR family protein n=1 Tax=Actinoplanes subtropicus TaxID=543632 RepID=UPI0004C2F7F5|nr:NADAR family protein [Actinoplanes subtropicus]